LEQFAQNWSDRWTASEATKETSADGEVFSYVGEWTVEEPSVYPGLKGDLGLVAKSPAAHHAISASLPEVIDNKDKTLVVQYVDLLITLRNSRFRWIAHKSLGSAYCVTETAFCFYSLLQFNRYEVKAQRGLECGGAYMKLLTESPEGIKFKEFSNETPYVRQTRRFFYAIFVSTLEK